MPFVNDRVLASFAADTIKLMNDHPPTSVSSKTTPPELFNDIHFLATRLAAVGAVAANRDLAAVGLRVRSYSVLSLACTASPQTQKEIAELLLLDPSQVVMLVDELETRALVRRIPDPNDRRARIVVATEEGQRQYSRARQIVADADRPTLLALDDNERADLRRLLRRVAIGSETN